MQLVSPVPGLRLPAARYPCTPPESGCMHIQYAERTRGGMLKYRNGTCVLSCTDSCPPFCFNMTWSAYTKTLLLSYAHYIKPRLHPLPLPPIYLLWRELRSLHGSLNGHGAQLGRREGGQGTAETADRGPHGAGNHHLVWSGPPPEAARRTAGEESAENARPASSEC